MNITQRDEVLSTTEYVAAGNTERETGPAGAGMAREERPGPLFPDTEAQDLRSRWSDIQAAFVDEPRQAVEKADQLVALAVKRLAESFSGERSKLEKQWAQGDISTEDLRVALQRYRSFFNRLLSV